MKEALSLHEAFLERMQEILGDEMPAFLEAMQGEPVISLRKNPLKPAEIYPEGRPIPWCETGLYLDERPRFVRDPLIHAGAYYVQEASSMLIARCLSPAGGQVVLDLCAAPGGKSTLLLSHLSPDSLLISNEIVGSRAIVLKENLIRWGYPNSLVSHNHPRDFVALPEFFDAIVVDAPCSGEGMFRKDPAVIQHWSPANVRQCAVRQKEILTAAAVALRKGGRLIYSTCTYNKEENEEIVQWLLSEAPCGFEIVPLDFPREWGLEPGSTDRFPAEMAHTYHAYLHKVAGEGFFLACLQKTTSVQGVSGETNTKKAKKHRPKPGFRDEKKENRWAGQERKAVWSEKELKREAEKYLAHSEKYHLEVENEEVVAQIKAWTEQIRVLKERLQIHKTGITLGKASGQKFIPDHELAMSGEAHARIPRLELDYDNAIRFLKRDQVQAPDSSLKGWVLVTYQGITLGWAKALENRINIHLPKSWRIRADISDW
ncbi:MAG: hypothetical protein H6581_03735 [Bacteroidia bacterium]|nr:hypothetical protein [Bacteroidia bacterium]